MLFGRRTIFGHLFAVFSIIILVAIGFFSAFNYVSVNDRLSAIAVQGLVALSRSLVVNIDTQLQNLNRISMAPIFSHPLQDLLRDSWQAPGTVGAIIDQVSTANGAIQGVRQINLYNLGGEMIGIGAPQGLLSVDVRAKPWFSMVQKAAGDRIITEVHSDPLIAKLFQLDRNRRYISLCRAYRDWVNGKYMIIEVEQDCSELFQYLDILQESSQNGLRIAIITNDGTQIYPYNKALPDLDWIVAGRPEDISIQIINSRAPQTGRNTVLAYNHSMTADWNLVLIQDEERLYADVPEFARQMLIYAVLVSLVALIGSFWAAKRVSVPLHRLSGRMSDFSLEEKQRSNPTRPSGLAELDDLNQAFGRLSAELRQSFAEAVLLKTHKHRAQLLALQSQMNPHFMFNMLANIGVLAENGEAAAIQAIVDDMAEMMRYIASSEEGGHTLQDEFDFIRRYLQCLKHRFPQDLEYRLDCPEELAKLEVPRLVLQPFIENALKYTTQKRPPWVLSLSARNLGRIEGQEDKWQVEIEDNGPGFDPASLASVQAEVRRIKDMAADLDDLPSLHVEGMGLINTFVRLKLYYGESAIMEFGNRPEGGAFVRIGGRIGL